MHRLTSNLQTHLIAPEKVIYIDYGDTCIPVSYTHLILRQATGGIRNEVNTFLSDYAVPVIAMLLIVGVGIGVVMNYDKIIDLSLIHILTLCHLRSAR